MSLDIKKLLELGSQPKVSQWELSNIIWYDRASNPEVLVQFINRIDYLQSKTDISDSERHELNALVDLASEMDQEECEYLLSNDDELCKQRHLESLARRGALETLCNNAISIETMENMCRLNPTDFILTAKRSQDLINSIQELVIQGETLSSDVAGA